MDIKITMRKIKEDCIAKIAFIINVHLTLMGLAEADKISREEFEYMYGRLEECKSTFKEMNIACDNTIKQYSMV